MFTAILIFGMLTVSTGLVFLRKNGPVILWGLLALVLYGWITEQVLAINCWKWWQLEPNLFYNIYSLFDITVWGFIFYHIFFQRRKLQLLILILWLIIIVYSFIELTVFYNFNTFHSRSYLCFSVAMLALSFTYFFSIQRKETPHDLRKDYSIWLCASAVCFHVVFFINLLTVIDADYWQYPDTLRVFHIFQSIAIIIHYIFICTAFIFSRYRRPDNHYRFTSPGR